MNSRLTGFFYVLMGITFIVIGVRNTEATNSYNWVNYLIGASAILIGIMRLRGRPPVG